MTARFRSERRLFRRSREPAPPLGIGVHFGDYHAALTGSAVSVLAARTVSQSVRTRSHS
jgi:hypothetical protein